jgi:hypothetical protein
MSVMPLTLTVEDGTVPPGSACCSGGRSGSARLPHLSRMALVRQRGICDDYIPMTRTGQSFLALQPCENANEKWPRLARQEWPHPHRRPRTAWRRPGQTPPRRDWPTQTPQSGLYCWCVRCICSARRVGTQPHRRPLQTSDLRNDELAARTEAMATPSNGRPSPSPRPPRSAACRRARFSAFRQRERTEVVFEVSPTWPQKISQESSQRVANRQSCGRVAWACKSVQCGQCPAGPRRASCPS